MALDQNLLYKIALSKVPHVGPVMAKLIVSYLGGCREIFQAKKSKLLSVPGVGVKTVEGLMSKEPLLEAEREIKFIEKHGIEVLFFGDEAYPSRLKQYEDSPTILYYKGNTSLESQRIVGIVGTRKPTEYGKIQCQKLVEQLQPYNALIVSGLAYGVDSIAHKSAVDVGSATVGVLGHGLDRIYPASNIKLSVRMIENGGLLTEFTSGTNPDRENFPMRNRIIAALSDVVVVVESADKGGSIITAEFANQYHKDVFAFPGRVGDSLSQGCNTLIKQHKASLLESAADIAYIMRWEDADRPAKQASLFLDLDGEELLIYQYLQGKTEIPIDVLHHELQLPLGSLSNHLLNLEFKGVVKSLPGKRYLAI